MFSVANQLDLINKEVELYKGRIDQQEVQSLAGHVQRVCRANTGWEGIETRWK